MNKREYCQAHPFIAWKNEIIGVTTFIHGFEYGVDDYVISRIAWGDQTDPDRCTYHRNKIRYNTKGEPYYISIFGRKYLKEFFRRVAADGYTDQMNTIGGIK